VRRRRNVLFKPIGTAGEADHARRARIENDSHVFRRGAEAHINYFGEKNMSTSLALTTARHGLSGSDVNRRRRFLLLLAGLAGAAVSPWSQADNVTQVTRQHIDNWNQTLQSGNIDDILDLYAETQPMLCSPTAKSRTPPSP
jgi:hypothetical protein